MAGKPATMAAHEEDDRWLVYILRCADGTLYTGITTNLVRRFQQHNDGVASRYTRSRLPVKMEYQESQLSHSEALKRELVIKKLSRQKKEDLFRPGPGLM
jgi:predicted GIY-YIG superfamily endonuclease